MSGSLSLLEKVETLKNLLVAYVTGDLSASPSKYVDLRRELVADLAVRDALPVSVRTCRTLDEFQGFCNFDHESLAERREFLRQEFNPILTALESATPVPSDSLISEKLAQISWPEVDSAWQKALERRDDDPDGAVTAARSLLEAVCKHVLDDLSVPYDDGWKLPRLYGATARELKLSPSQHTEQVFKQILSGCQSVVEGLGALRNDLGDAHGQGKRGYKPAPRHAELAVNLAGAVALFLIATHEARCSTEPGN